MSDSKTPLDREREHIDAIDYRIHDLLNERAQHVLQVAAIKIQQDGELTNFYRPDREAEIFQRINDYNKGPLSAQAITKIFKSIIHESIELQKQQVNNT